MSEARLLIYAINGKGMGHLNRTLVLARAAKAFAPETQILFAVASPLFWLVRDSGFPVLKVPDRNHTLGFHAGKPARAHHLHAVFAPIFDWYKPTAFVVDMTINERLFRESSKHGAQVAVVLRKQRASVLATSRRDPAIKYIDRFLVPHPEDESPLAEIPHRWRSRVRRVGAVVRTLQVERIPEAKARYSASGRPLVVVTIGGGGFAESYDTLRAAEQAAVSSATEFDWVIVYGPYFTGTIPKSDGNIHRVKFDPDLLELCAAADVIICNAGYNTIRELAVAGTPAVVIPLKGTGADDQFERATLLAREGRAVIGQANAEALLGQVRQLAQASPTLRRAPEPGELATILGQRFLDALAT